MKDRSLRWQNCGVPAWVAGTDDGGWKGKQIFERMSGEGEWCPGWE